jgi:hypothetical protein
MRRQIREWKLSNLSRRLSLDSTRATALRHRRRVGAVAVAAVAGTGSPGARPWRDDPRLASKPSASVRSRLEAGTTEAARGDCLRGEFKGNDMGLLRLPMMGLAAAQGRCRLP